MDHTSHGPYAPSTRVKKKKSGTAKQPTAPILALILRIGLLSRVGMRTKFY